MDKAGALLERVRQWDQAALAEVYDAYAPAIYRYVYRRTGHVDLAHDITAETFHRLLVALKNSNGPERHLSAWLYRVAHNLVIDTYRRSPTIEPTPLDEANLVDPKQQTDRLEEKEQAARAREAMQKLTPLQQHVLTLRFLEGMSLEEVALVVNRNVGSVKSLQHRALESMRRLLEEFDEVPT